MGYQTGTASSAIDMMDKIRVVAVSQGWVTDYNADIIAATTRFLSLRKGAVNFNFRIDNRSTDINSNPNNPGGFVTMNMSVGFVSTSPFESQPNSSYDTNDGPYNPITNSLTGANTSYHIFYDTDYVHTVIETQPGIYSYICFGILDKYGAYTGGEYMACSSWNYSTTYVNNAEGLHTYLFDSNPTNTSFGSGYILRVEVDGRRYFLNNYYTPTGTFCTGIVKDSAGRNLIPYSDIPNSKEFLATPNVFNQVTPLLNTPLYIERASSLFTPVGEVKGLRAINMTNYNHKDIITIGGDNWMLFPAKQKSFSRNGNTSTNTPNSWLYGYAFKKF